MTELKGYRSHIVNGLAALIAVIALPEVGGIVPSEYAAYIPLVQGALAIIMRQLTTTPVGTAE